MSVRTARRVAPGRRLARRAGVDGFLLLCVVHGLPRPETEVVFASPRKYRADYLFPGTPLTDWRGVIVERNGGIWRKGGHSSGRGILRDYAKSNLAQIEGFLYLQYTPEQLENGVAIADLQQVLR